MATPVSIVIPAFNQLPYCRQCVESILANTDHPYRLILVDNGSTDGVGEYFDSVSGALALHSESNRGFAGGANLGLARVEGHALVLNSDTLVPRNWLSRLVAALERPGDIGLVGPMSNYVAGIQMIPDLEFNSTEEISAYADRLAAEHDGQVFDVDRIIGFCMLIREEALKQVGLFDESFGIGNFEDDDYCVRVRRSGFRISVARDCFVFHYGNRTFMGMGLIGQEFDRLLDTNREIFLGKWKAGPEANAEAERLDGEARIALAANDTGKALALLLEGAGKCPCHAATHNDLGAVLWLLGERERACACFQRALRLDPGYDEARANLRDAARALGKDLDDGGIG